MKKQKSPAVVPSGENRDPNSYIDRLLDEQAELIRTQSGHAAPKKPRSKHGGAILVAVLAVTAVAALGYALFGGALETALTSRIEADETSGVACAELRESGLARLLERESAAADGQTVRTYLAEEKRLAFGSGEQETRGFGGLAFTATSEDGDVLFCHDYDSPLAAEPVFVRARESGTAAMADGLALGKVTGAVLGGEKTPARTAALPFCGRSGMNDRGVAAAVLSVPKGEPAKRAFAASPEVILQLVLERADSLDSAVALLDENAVVTDGSPVHFLIADRTGASAVVELTADGAKAVPGDGGVQIAAGHNLLPELAGGVSGDSEIRAAAVDTALAPTGGRVSAQSALDILGQCGGWSSPDESSLRWSVVYDLTTGAVIVRAAGCTRAAQYSLPMSGE